MSANKCECSYPLMTKGHAEDCPNRDRSSRPVAQASPAKCEAVGMGSTPTVPTAPTHDNATPRPWRLSDKSKRLIIGYEARLYPQMERFTIARIDAAEYHLPPEVAEANAALIVESANQHDSLKARIAELEGALKEFCDSYKANHDQSTDSTLAALWTAFLKARAALAAKGGK